MANQNIDIIRVHTTKALMPTTLINGQLGKTTDTDEIAWKNLSGVMHYYGKTSAIDLTDIEITDNTSDAFRVRESTREYININTTNSSEKITIGNATTNPDVVILGTGNVGIGTSSPSAKLDVGTVTDPEITMDASASGHLRVSGGTYSFAIANNSTGTYLYHNGSSRAMVFGINETECMRIDSAGDLNVLNDLNVTGDIEVSGTGPHAIGGSADGHEQLNLTGSFTSDGGSTYAGALLIDTDLTGANGDTANLALLNIFGTITTQDGADTIADVAAVKIDEPRITKGASDTITNASSLLITGTPTEGVNNYAILVDSGDTALNTTYINKGDAGGGTAPAAADELVVESSGSGGITIITPDANSSAIYLGGNSDTDASYINFSNLSKALSIGTQTATGTIAFATGAGVQALSIDSSQDATFIGDIYMDGVSLISASSSLTIATSTATTSYIYFKPASGAAHDKSVLSLSGEADFGDSVVNFFPSPAEGDTPIFNINGYKTGDANARQLIIRISPTADDTVNFDGVSDYYFDGTIVTKEVYEDIYLPISVTKVGATAPSWSTFFGNLSQYTFAINDYVEGSFELPHGYKEGTNLDIHAHIVTNGAEAGVEARYSFEYWIADMGEASTTTTTITSSDYTLTNADGHHEYIDIGNISGTGFEIGAIVCFRFQRVALVGGSNPSNDPFVVSVGCHYQKDTMGSRSETSK